MAAVGCGEIQLNLFENRLLFSMNAQNKDDCTIAPLGLPIAFGTAVSQRCSPRQPDTQALLISEVSGEEDAND